MPDIADSDPVHKPQHAFAIRPKVDGGLRMPAHARVWSILALANARPYERLSRF